MFFASFSNEVQKCLWLIMQITKREGKAESTTEMQKVTQVGLEECREIRAA